MDTGKSIVFMVFHSIVQANVIKGVLESSGIPCFLSNEGGAIVNPMFGTDNSLVRLHLLEENLPLAKQILSGKQVESDDNQ